MKKIIFSIFLFFFLGVNSTFSAWEKLNNNDLLLYTRTDCVPKWYYIQNSNNHSLEFSACNSNTAVYTNLWRKSINWDNLGYLIHTELWIFNFYNWNRNGSSYSFWNWLLNNRETWEIVQIARNSQRYYSWVEIKYCWWNSFDINMYWTWINANSLDWTYTNWQNCSWNPSLTLSWWSDNWKIENYLYKVEDWNAFFWYIDNSNVFRVTILPSSSSTMQTFIIWLPELPANVYSYNLAVSDSRLFYSVIRNDGSSKLYELIWSTFIETPNTSVYLFASIPNKPNLYWIDCNEDWINCLSILSTSYNKKLSIWTFYDVLSKEYRVYYRNVAYEFYSSNSIDLSDIWGGWGEEWWETWNLNCEKVVIPNPNPIYYNYISTNNYITSEDTFTEKSYLSFECTEWVWINCHASTDSWDKWQMGNLVNAFSTWWISFTWKIWSLVWTFYAPNLWFSTSNWEYAFDKFNWINWLFIETNDKFPWFHIYECKDYSTDPVYFVADESKPIIPVWQKNNFITYEELWESKHLYFSNTQKYSSICLKFNNTNQTYDFKLHFFTNNSKLETKEVCKDKSWNYYINDEYIWKTDDDIKDYFINKGNWTLPSKENVVSWVCSWNRGTFDFLRSPICYITQVLDNIFNKIWKILDFFTWNSEDIEDLWDSETWINQEWFYELNSAWEIELDFWSSLNPIEYEKNNSCKMINKNNLTFIYNSNWHVGINFSLQQYELFTDTTLGWIWDKLTWIIIWPLNAIIWISWILIPFSEQTKEYCLFWKVVQIEHHKLFKNTEYYQEFTFIDYLVLFATSLLLLTTFWIIRPFAKSEEENTPRPINVVIEQKWPRAYNPKPPKNTKK